MAYTVIRSRERLFALLARLRDHHTLILLHNRPESPEPSLSMLLSIDLDSDFLILDSPVDVDRLELEPGNEIHVTANLQGIDIRFQCQFEAFVDYEGDIALRVAWPQALKYLERRSDYRVRISAEHAGLELTRDEGEEERQAIDGQIIDLSLGGFGALVEDSPILEKGEVLDCTLEFREQELTVKAEIRRKSSRSTRGECHIGARFARLDPRQKRLLERIVAQLERRAIRADPTR